MSAGYVQTDLKPFSPVPDRTPGGLRTTMLVYLKDHRAEPCETGGSRSKRGRNEPVLAP